ELRRGIRYRWLSLATPEKSMRPSSSRSSRSRMRGLGKWRTPSRGSRRPQFGSFRITRPTASSDAFHSGAPFVPPLSDDKSLALLDDFVRPLQQGRRDRQAEGLGGLEVDDQLELG